MPPDNDVRSFYQQVMVSAYNMNDILMFIANGDIRFLHKVGFDLFKKTVCKNCQQYTECNIDCKFSIQGKRDLQLVASGMIKDTGRLIYCEKSGVTESLQTMIYLASNELHRAYKEKLNSILNRNYEESGDAG